MSYIGNTPTSVPLTSADLEDNIISTAKIQDNAVTAAKYIEPIPFRNIIINGDMNIAQRSTSVAGITGQGYNTIDRFETHASSLGTWTQSQSTDVPTGQGFATSLKMDCTTADASPSAGDFLYVRQKVEGQNLQYLKKGTANAESTTLSFWVRSNKTGTYIAELYDIDNNRTISNSYTISLADTWEKKTLTYAGDTTGAFGNDNGRSLDVAFWLGAGTTYTSGTLQTSWGSQTNANRAVGQVNLADDTANEWYVTGVQLEAGTTASDFEFLPVDVNKNRCLRYYYVHVEGSSKEIACGFYYNSSYLTCHLQFPQEMRTAPSFIGTSGTNYYKAWRANTSNNFDAFNEGIQNATTTSCGIDGTTGVSGTQGEGNRIITNNASSLIAFSSEL
jgi:hypothetical protein